MTIYKVTDGNDVHQFTLESDALVYIQSHPSAVLEVVELPAQEIDIDAQIENIYMNAQWQSYLDLLETRGISHPLLSSTDSNIRLDAWNLYHTIVRLKNWEIYQRPLVQDYRTFVYLFNTLVYTMTTETILVLFEITLSCGIVILNQPELIGNLKALGKLPSNY